MSMHECNSKDSLEILQRQLESWEKHIRTLALYDRQRFIEWLPQVLSEEELALIIDGEILRSALWDIYLYEHYGP